MAKERRRRQEEFRGRYRGVEVDGATLRWPERLVRENPRLTRSEVSLAMCRRFKLLRVDGSYAVDRCRLFLGRPERRGLLKLPARKRTGNFVERRRGRAPGGAVAAPVGEEVSGVDLRSVELRPLKAGELARFSALLAQHRYLGCSGFVGERLLYVAESSGRWVALLAWAAAALKNGARKRYLGWTEDQRRERLHLVVNNVRFLILPWVKTPHLASRLLARNLRRLSADWNRTYGHLVLLAETELGDDVEFPYLRQVFRLDRERIINKTGEVSTEAVPLQPSVEG